VGQVPSAELQELWLDAVRLPEVSDPRESCLVELSEYTGESRDVIEQRCKRAVDEQRELWYQRDRSDESSLTDFYNECDAYLYELLWWHALQQGAAPAWNARLLDIAENFGCRDYLDFGGGIGTNAILLGRAGLNVTVADVSDILQSCAKWRLQKRGIDATLIDLKAEQPQPESYDLISAIDVLEHVADPLATLTQLQRSLKPGGILVFDLIAGDADPDRPFHLLRSKFPIRSEIRGLGFRRVEHFQKYLVYQKVHRDEALQRFTRVWDIARWRAYYLLQGRWP